MSHTHVVLGASGGAGSAIVTALARAGLSTRAVNRRGDAVVPDGVQRVAADITTAEGATSAVRGADVVHMAAQPDYSRWPQEFPPMLEHVIRATASVGAKLVLVDNLYAYGPTDAPMQESTAAAATDAKGVVRARMAARLLAAHRDGELRVTIGRAADYFGPGVTNSVLAALAFQPLADPKGTLRWVGRDDVAHSTAFMPDIARAIVTLATDDRADGKVWHLPHEPAVTGAAFLSMINATLPAARRTGRVAPWMLRLIAPFHPPSKEILGVMHQWDRPFVVDDSRFRTTFGFQGTPMQRAIADTVAIGSSPLVG